MSRPTIGRSGAWSYWFSGRQKYGAKDFKDLQVQDTAAWDPKRQQWQYKTDPKKWAGKVSPFASDAIKGKQIGGTSSGVKWKDSGDYWRQLKWVKPKDTDFDVEDPTKALAGQGSPTDWMTRSTDRGGWAGNLDRRVVGNYTGNLERDMTAAERRQKRGAQQTGIKQFDRAERAKRTGLAIN